MTITEGIEQRRSIRKYTEQEVEREKIEEVLRAALLAPSGKNRQPWKYLVYQSEEKEKLPESRHGLPSAFHTLRIMRQAPVLIVVLNTNAKSPFEEIKTDERLSEICDSLSIGASIQNMLLRATELGLGSLWIGNTCFAYTEIVEYLKTEDQLAGAVSLGYAAESPAARPRKDWEEVVEFR